MKRIRNVLAVLGIGLTAVMLVAEPASADPLSDEVAFVQKLNELRASQGLSQLGVRTDITALARNWSAQMAAAGGISHNPGLVAQAPWDWTRLGENVGVGGDVQSLHDAFVNSPSHYANMVNPYFTHVGVGVVWSNGLIFVTVEFMTGGAPPPQATKTSCTKNTRGKTVCRKAKVKKARARRR